MTGPATEAAIGAVYAAVRAPAWAAPNLDGLADVLRDLSWLPAGPVPVALPADRAVRRVVERAIAETAGSAHPVRRAE